MTPEEALEQGHEIDWKIVIKQTEIQHNCNHYPIFHLFPKFENTACSTRQVTALWIQAVKFSAVALRQPQASEQAQLWKG